MLDLLLEEYERLERSVKLRTWVTVILGALLVFMTCVSISVTKSFNDIQKLYRMLAETNVGLVAEVENLHEKYDLLVREKEVKEEVVEEPNAGVEETSADTDILAIAGAEYGIDPKLLEAIERLESGHYTSNLYLTKNNTWGAYNSAIGDFYAFESREQSTMTLAKNLRLYYFDQGLDTLEEIGSKYCPGDPSWAAKVRSIMEAL